MAQRTDTQMWKQQSSSEICTISYEQLQFWWREIIIFWKAQNIIYILKCEIFVSML